MRIKDVMTKNPAVCAPNTKLEDVAGLMLAHNCGEIPIVQDGALLGVVTDRDIACRAVAKGLNPLVMPARDIMTPNVFTITENEDVDVALAQMREHQVRRLPVVRDDKLIGIVSVADLVNNVPSPKAAELVTAVSALDVAVPAP